MSQRVCFVVECVSFAISKQNHLVISARGQWAHTRHHGFEGEVKFEMQRKEALIANGERYISISLRSTHIIVKGFFL